MISSEQARTLAQSDLKEGRDVAEQVLVNLEEEFGKDSAAAKAYRSELKTTMEDPK